MRKRKCKIKIQKKERERKRKRSCSRRDLHWRKIPIEIENGILVRRSSGRIKRLGRIGGIVKPRVTSRGFPSDYSRGNRWRVAHFLGPTSSSSRGWIFHLERSSHPNKRETSRRGLKEGHIKLWIFHRRKSSASDSASSMELSFLGFSTSLFHSSSFFFRLFYFIASLKSNAQNGWHISPLSERQKKRKREREKKREMYKREAEYWTVPNVSCKSEFMSRQIIHESRPGSHHCSS